MSRSIKTSRVATVLALAMLPFAGATLAAPAQAAPVTVPFQVQTFVLADLPSPRISATVGNETGLATLSAESPNPTAGAIAGPIGVRWISLSTGAAGHVVFPAGNPKPAPIDIRPGVGQVVAIIEGGLFPGFGSFYVP